ncbi:MAG: hypothetical protein HKP30_06500 [Myxococcales bacterium]|nr:hypothetical protein [Myxococcales bacterium]
MDLERRCAALALSALLLTSAGCFNGGQVTYEDGGPRGRFALVIEADRTAIEGSHFLLDTATGDVWRMESEDGRAGSWVRLGDAPDDVAELELVTEGNAEDDDA